MRLATKLNGSGSNASDYSDEVVGPIKPGFSFYRWLGCGPHLQVPIPEMIVVDELSPPRHLFTNERGYVTSFTPKFTSQIDRDAFMSKYINTFVTHSKPLTNTPEAVYNRTVAVAKKPYFDSHSGDMIHSNQKTEILTPLTVQSLLLQAMDNTLEPCVIQQFVKCRATHANIYRAVYKVTSMDSGSVTGYSVGNMSSEYRAMDLIATFQPPSEATQQQDSEQQQHVLNHLYGEKKSRIKFGADTKDAHSEQAAANGNVGQRRGSILLGDPLISKAEQMEVLYKRKATRLIAAYVKAALKHESDSKVRDNDLSTAAVKSSANTTNTTNTTATPPRKRPSSAQTTQKSRSPPLLTEQSLQLNDTRNSTFLTTPATDDSSRPSSANPSPSNRKRVMARLLRSDTALTFNSERASDATAHQTQLHKYLDVFSEKTNEELSRLFVKGMGLNLHMSVADREEAIVIGKYVHDQIGLSHNLCSMTDAHHQLTDQTLKRLSITRINEHALGTLKGYLANITKWLQAVLISEHKLSVQLEEIVCDFMKDEENNYYFTNLKAFTLTQESLQKVRMWHDRAVLGLSYEDTEEPVVSTREWRFKQVSLAAVTCRLCGVQHMPNELSTVPAKYSADLLAPAGKPNKINTTNNRPGGIVLPKTPVTAPTTADPDDIDSYIEAQTALLFARRNTTNSAYVPSPTKSRIQATVEPTVPPLNPVVQLSKAEKRAEPTIEVPSCGYRLPAKSAAQLAQIYQYHGHPLTTLSKSLLETYSPIHTQSTDAEKQRVLLARQSQSAVDCCYMCFSAYKQYSVMRRKLHAMMKTIQKSSEVDSSGGLYDSEGDEKRPTSSMPASNYQTLQTLSLNKEATQYSSAATEVIQSSSPLLFSPSLDIKKVPRPKSAGSVRTRPLSGTATGMKALSQLSLALEESEKQLGIAVKQATQTKKLSRPSSAKNKGTTSSEMRISAVQHQDSDVEEKGAIPIRSAHTVAEDVQVRRKGLPEKFEELQRYSSRHNKAEMSALLTRNRVGGISNGDALKNASYLGRDAGHYRIFLMVHYLVHEQQHEDRYKARDIGAPFVGCIAYTLGQSQNVLNFAHNTDTQAGRDSQGRLVWVQQCRLHYAFGSAKDISKLFGEKLLQFSIYSHSEPPSGEDVTRQVVSQTRATVTSKTLPAGGNSANALSVSASALEQRAAATALKAEKTKRGGGDYEVTKCVTLNEEEEEGSGAESEEKEHYQSSVEALAGTANGDTECKSDDRFIGGLDEKLTVIGDNRSRPTRQKHREVQLEGQFQVSLERLRWAGTSVREGTEKVDLIVPLQLRTLGNMSIKLSVAVVRDDPLPAAVAQTSKGFVEESGVFFPSACYSDGHYALPPSWLSMLTERPAEIEYYHEQPAETLQTTVPNLTSLQVLASGNVTVPVSSSSGTTPTKQQPAVGSRQQSSPPRRSSVFIGTTPELHPLNRILEDSATEDADLHAPDNHTATFSAADQIAFSETVDAFKMSPAKRSAIGPSRVRQSFLNNTATTSIRNSFVGTSGASGAATRQSIAGMRKSFVGQLYSALEQFNGGSGSGGGGESATTSRVSGSDTHSNSNHNNSNLNTIEEQTVTIEDVLDSKLDLTSSRNSASTNSYVNQYEQFLQSAKQKLSAQHMSELEQLCVEFQTVMDRHIQQLDNTAIENSRKAHQLMQSLAEGPEDSLHIVTDADNKLVVVPTDFSPPADFQAPRKASMTGLLSAIGNKKAAFSFKRALSISTLQTDSVSQKSTPTNESTPVAADFSTATPSLKSPGKSPKKPSEMVLEDGGSDSDSSSDGSDAEENAGNSNGGGTRTPFGASAKNLLIDTPVSDSAGGMIDIAVVSPPVVTPARTPNGKDLFRKVFGRVIAANRRASAAALPTAASMFEKVIDDAVVDYQYEGVLSRHMGVMDSKEAVNLLSLRLGELRQKQQQHARARASRLVLNTGTNDFNNSVMAENEQQHVSDYMLELMNMTLKHLFVLDYLPERINWTLLRPLLVEVVYDLINVKTV